MLVVVGSTAAPIVTFVGLDGEPVDCDETPSCFVTARHGGGGTEPADVEHTGTAGTYRGIFTVESLGPTDVVFEGEVDGRSQVLTTSVDGVSTVLATPLDVRAHPDMRSRQNTKVSRLGDLLEEFTDLATEYRGFSPILRRAVTDLTCGRTLLPWPKVQEILTVTTADGTVVAGPHTYLDAAWQRRTGWSHSTASVAYVHGAPSVAQGMRRAAIGWVAFSVVAEDQGMARDVLWETTESGSVRYSSPDWARGRPTGFNVVDNGLNAQPDLRYPGMG